MRTLMRADCIPYSADVAKPSQRDTIHFALRTDLLSQLLNFDRDRDRDVTVAVRVGAGTELNFPMLSMSVFNVQSIIHH